MLDSAFWHTSTLSQRIVGSMRSRQTRQLACRSSLHLGNSAGDLRFRLERSARFERVSCPAAIALAVAQDAVDDARVGNKGDDAHAGAAGSASQGVSLEDFPDQTGPRAGSLPGEIGIVPLAGGDAGGAIVGSRRRAQDSAPVGIVEKSIFDLPRILINGGKRGFLVEIDPNALRSALTITEVEVAIQ